MKAIGITQFLDKSFDTYDVEGECFGGNKPFVIWDKKDNTPVQQKLF